MRSRLLLLRTQLQHRAFATKPFEVLQTTVPSIYTTTPLDPTLDLTRHKADAAKVFTLPTKYVLPSEFNFVYPVGNVPEFAFVGRSNVGKSSLIEALLGNPNLVRTSKMPGCTRSVNFFAFVRGKNSHTTYLVDLPGYGFAKAARDEKARWEAFIQGYLRDRPQAVLRRVYLLVDARHGAKPSDVEMMKLLDSCALPYQVVLTKADLITAAERQRALRSVFEQLNAKRMSSAMPYAHVVSSRSGEGVADLQLAMGEIIAQEWVNHLAEAGRAGRAGPAVIDAADAEEYFGDYTDELDSEEEEGGASPRVRSNSIDKLRLISEADDSNDRRQ